MLVFWRVYLNPLKRPNDLYQRVTLKSLVFKGGCFAPNSGRKETIPPSINIYIYMQIIHILHHVTLPETNSSAPENGRLKYDVGARPIFRGFSC